MPPHGTAISCAADAASLSRRLVAVGWQRPSGVPAAARAFVATTMTLTERPAHEVAAASLHGREDLVPEMFRQRLATLDADRGDPARYRSFRRYLERHIDLDENDLDENDLDESDHSPLAHDLLRSLCGEDEVK